MGLKLLFPKDVKAVKFWRRILTESLNDSFKEEHNYFKIHFYFYDVINNFSLQNLNNFEKLKNFWSNKIKDSRFLKGCRMVVISHSILNNLYFLSCRRNMQTRREQANENSFEFWIWIRGEHRCGMQMCIAVLVRFYFQRVWPTFSS